MDIIFKHIPQPEVEYREKLNPETGAVIKKYFKGQILINFESDGDVKMFNTWKVAYKIQSALASIDKLKI